MSRMHEICFILEQLVETFDNVPLSEQQLVTHGHELVPHICLQSMYEMDSLVEETLEEVLLYISSIVGQSQFFLSNSAFKFLSDSSIIQRICVTLFLVIIVQYFCNLLIFNCKDSRFWRDYQLLQDFSYPELAQIITSYCYNEMLLELQLSKNKFEIYCLFVLKHVCCHKE